MLEEQEEDQLAVRRLEEEEGQWRVGSRQEVLAGKEPR
jgi:hypothetical protein